MTTATRERTATALQAVPTPLQVSGPQVAALAPLLRRHRRHTLVRAQRSRRAFNWTDHTGRTHRARRGDWRCRDEHYEWAVVDAVFACRYRRVGDGLYQRRTDVYAARLWRAFGVDTDHGPTAGCPGDWLCLGDVGDLWPVAAAAFAGTYRPVGRTLCDAELPGWAARAAASLLGPLGNRWEHTKAVARQAGGLAHLLPPGQRPLLLAAAWAHDLGRSPALAATGFHPLDGARALTGLLPPTVVALIAHHTGAIHEARRRGLTRALAAYPRTAGPLADALTFADLTAGAGGQETNVGDRLADIHRRYGSDSLTSRAVADAAPDLLAAVSRTQSRLLADRVRRTRLPRPAAAGPSHAASIEIATTEEKP